MSRLLITGSRAHQWTPYDSHALLIAVREILEKTHELPVLVHGGATGADTEAARVGQQLLNLPQTTSALRSPLIPRAGLLKIQNGSKPR